MSVFLTAFGGTSVALLVAGFLGRNFIKIQVSRAIEKYKAELQQKSEILKTELSIYAHEQNVGLSRLDEQRSEAIKSIYAVANQWQELFLEIVRPVPPQLPPELQISRYLNLAKNLVKTAEKLSIRSRDNAIFFQQQSYEVIAKYGLAAMDLSCAFYDNTFGTLNREYGLAKPELLPVVEKERVVLRESPKEDFGQVQALLMSEFRKLMKAERGK
jgi:hypothetical protein